MSFYKLLFIYLAVVLIQAEKNETEATFFSKYPQVSTAVITGLTIVALAFSFCCFLLLCYICIGSREEGRPTIVQSLSDSLRRRHRIPSIIEAHASEFSTRTEEHCYEALAAHPEQSQPPKLPTSPRPNQQPTLGGATAQPKMGLQVKGRPIPKKRGLKKPPYVNLDPELVAAEQILTQEVEDSSSGRNRRTSLKRMVSFRPNIWAHLDRDIAHSSRFSNISMTCFPDEDPNEPETTPPPSDCNGKEETAV